MLKLKKPLIVPINDRILCQGVSITKTKGGLIAVTNQEKLYAVAISKDCKSFGNLQIGDEVFPAVPPDERASIKFQVVRDSNENKFVVMYETELAGFEPNTEGFEWENAK